MSNKVPADLKYTESHEWIQVNKDGTVTVGITDHAQSALGDLVHLELPEMDSELKQGDECGVVESVKAASDLYAPLSGKVIDINENLLDEPELVNLQPYKKGWMFKMELADKGQLAGLLNADAYRALLEE